MKHRLLFLTQSLAAGGTERQLLYLLQQLDRSRFEPTVGVLFNARGNLRPAYDATGVPIVELGLRQPLLQAGNWKPLRHCLRWLRGQQLDLIHAWLYHANILGLLLGQRAGVRRIIISERNAGYFHQGTHRWVARRLYSRAAAVVANARAIAEMLEQHRLAKREQVMVIPNGVFVPQHLPTEAEIALARLLVRAPPKATVIATVGRFAPIKGHKHFLAAAALVSQQHPHTLFVLAGEGEERSALEEQARALGIESQVRFVGHVENTSSFLAAVDVFVLPSLSEGMSNALLEAMALAKPIVATAVGGNTELIEPERHGLLVPPADPPAMAQALQRLLQSSELARSLGHAARERVQSCSIETMVQRYAALYERVLAQ